MLPPYEHNLAHMPVNCAYGMPDPIKLGLVAIASVIIKMRSVLRVWRVSSFFVLRSMDLSCSMHRLQFNFLRILFCRHDQLTADYDTSVALGMRVLEPIMGLHLHPNPHANL